MTNFKALVLASAMALTAAPAIASPITFATVGSNPTSDVATSSGGLWNISGGSTVTGVGADAFLTSLGIDSTSGATLVTEPVYVQFNSGAGVVTSAITSTAFGYQFTLSQALTVTYNFSTPTNVLGYNGIVNLLSVTFAAGTTVSDNFGFLTATADAATGVFGSDLFGFIGSTEQRAAVIGSQVNISIANGTTTLSSNVSGNFSADPYPRIPEAPSLALLVGGLAAVAYSSRRRAA